MDFEGILSEIGDFGRYQKSLIVGFLAPATFVSALSVLNAIFMVRSPDHWCRMPEVIGQYNLTLEEQKWISLPRRKTAFSRCKIYDRDYEQVLSNLSWSADGQATLYGRPLDQSQADPDLPSIPCTNGWQFDQSLYKYTAVTRWDLVCENDHLPSLVLTLANAGSAIGTIMFGAISDKFGRRAAFFLNLSVVLISGLLSISVPNFTMFAICRFLTGTALPANFQLPYIIVVEQVGPKARSRLVCLSWILWTLGGCTLPLLAYLTGDYVLLALVTTLPTLFGFLYWRFLPASPRFLLSAGRYQEASEVVERIARVNGRDTPPNLLSRLMKIGDTIKSSKLEGKAHSVTDLWRHKQLRKKLFIVTLSWCAIAVAYFGLILNVSNLGGNDFLNYFYLSVVELPAFLAAAWFMERLGRRWANASFICLAGAACLAVVVLPEAGGLSAILSSLVGKFGSAAAFMVIYQQAAELYPTPVRSLGMSIGSTVSQLAIICMPYVVYLGVYSPSIPFVIVGVICLLAATASPLVPETLNEKLPQTIEDSESFGAAQKFFSCARKRNMSEAVYPEVDSFGKDSNQANKSTNTEFLTSV